MMIPRKEALAFPKETLCMNGKAYFLGKIRKVFHMSEIFT